MEARDALEEFLRHSLGNKVERYLGFISKSKNQHKFLNSIYHELAEDLGPSKRVGKLTDCAMSMKGYKFSPSSNFGEAVESLSGAYDTHEDSFLIVSENGKFAIHGPETFIDSRAYYAV